MACEHEDSVTVWLTSLKNGDAEAAQKLWTRYFEALVRLARYQLRGAPGPLLTRKTRRLPHSTALSEVPPAAVIPGSTTATISRRLLVVITERKRLTSPSTSADKSAEEERLLAPQVGRPDADRGDGKIAGGSLSGVSPPSLRRPSQTNARRLLGLRDDSLRAVAALRMEGCTNEEVAQRLGCSLRTVARKVELIRRSWLGEDRTIS